MPAPDRAARAARAAISVLCVVLCAASAAGCGPGDAPPAAGSPPDPVTATVHARTNADRAARGLGPLAWDGSLAGLAAEWARYLADTGRLHHRDLAATLYRAGFEAFAALGENLLEGPGAVTGEQVEDAWLASPPHAANVLGDYDVIGVAVARGADGRVRVVADYGRFG